LIVLSPVPVLEETLMIRSHPAVATVFAASLLLIAGGSRAQQPKQMAPQPPAAQPAAPQLQQVALTDNQVQGLLDSQHEMDAITSKLPDDDPSKPPDARTIAQLDAVARKYGFANYAEYGNVAANVDMLLDGFDPKTRKFIGIEASLKNQIAMVQADTKMPAQDKKEALDELNDSLKTAPKIQFPANVDVVTRYYDKLNDALRTQQ
jgi:hypothetical protein